MRKLVQIISVVIILLGVLHIAFAFPIQFTTDTLWFIGSGVAIIFSGLINVVAINKGSGSTFAHSIALVSNALMCTLFCFAQQNKSEATRTSNPMPKQKEKLKK